MAAFMKLRADQTWTGSSGMFYNILEYLLKHIEGPPSLVGTLEFGFHSGTKFCDLSECSQPEIARIRELLVRYRDDELPTASRSWPNPDGLPQGVADVDRLIGLLAAA
jgi:hypothetical protein